MLARAALSQLRRQALPQQRGIASSALRLGGSKGPASDIPRNTYAFRNQVVSKNGIDTCSTTCNI
jgi:hypothetical protein